MKATLRLTEVLARLAVDFAARELALEVIRHAERVRPQ